MSGSFLLSVPSGALVLIGLFLCKKPLLFLLPSPLHTLLAPALELPGGRRGPVMVFLGFALWAGVCTHVIWDSFTHQSGWAVTRIPTLQIPLSGIGGAPLYYLLQQGSTVVGSLIVMAFLIAKLSPFRAEPGDGHRWLFWAGLITVSLSIALPLALRDTGELSGLLRFRSIMFQTAVYSGMFFAALCALSLVAVAHYLHRAPRA